MFHLPSLFRACLGMRASAQLRGTDQSESLNKMGSCTDLRNGADNEIDGCLILSFHSELHGDALALLERHPASRQHLGWLFRQRCETSKIQRVNRSGRGRFAAAEWLHAEKLDECVARSCRRERVNMMKQSEGGMR